MTSGSITVMLIFVCGRKWKILLSVPCHSNLNALVLRPVRVSLKIWSSDGIAFHVTGVRSLQEEERKGERRREEAKEREMQLILFAG